jgi:hypothetical protein
LQCQGSTIQKPAKVYADLNETFGAAMCYVILSRIMCLKQLVLAPFNQAKIYCNEEAKAEALGIRDRALNRQSSPWDISGSKTFKISTLNVRSLQKHFQDLNDDNFLQQSDILCVNETWLLSDPSSHFEGFCSHYLNMKSKGTALYSKLQIGHLQKVHSSSMSMIVARYELFDVLSVYRFSDSSDIEEFTNQVTSHLNFTKPALVLGDFNIDLLKLPENKFSQNLKECGFKQLVLQATHISGGLIDHVYAYLPNGEQCEVFKIHPLYYSDHDAVCCILKFP